MVQQILFIVTSHSQLGTTQRATGVYLPEFAQPWHAFTKAGYALQVASPQGGSVPIDPGSMTETWAGYVIHLQQTLPFSEIDPSHYAAIFVVGGHGTMWDLSDNILLQRLLATTYEQGKIVAAVCHGPAALIDVRLSTGQKLLEGKQVTGFSNREEEAAGLTQVVPFSLEDALRQAGASVQCAENWQSFVVVDGCLITGQNPASALAVSEAVIGALDIPTLVL